MANLKDLRIRIGSIKSTQKITAAMKLVAGVKFRKSEAEARNGRHYICALDNTVKYLCSCRNSLKNTHPLLFGYNNSLRNIVIIIYASDKGLCGSFNDAVRRAAFSYIGNFLKQGIGVNLICIGSKIVGPLSKRFPDIQIDSHTSSSFNDIDTLKLLSKQLLMRFYKQEIDKVFLLYSHFFSAINNEQRLLQVLPVLNASEGEAGDSKPDNQEISNQIPSFEIPEDQFITEIAEHNLVLQLKQASKESNASENGTRMTAMDNATKSAQDMVDELVLVYNRTRQAVVTAELIEVISGAEAL